MKTINLPGKPMEEPLSRAEALESLRTISARPEIASWAGEVCSVEAAAKALQLDELLLLDWISQRKVIALSNKDERLIPMAQFSDGQPLEGLAEVRAAMLENANVAWLWLMQPSPTFDGKAPIHALREGRTEEVVAAARRSSGW